MESEKEKEAKKRRNNVVLISTLNGNGNIPPPPPNPGRPTAPPQWKITAVDNLGRSYETDLSMKFLHVAAKIKVGESCR